MVKTLFTLTVSGSDCIQDKIPGMDVNVALFNRIGGSSYLPTPPKLDASR